MAPDGSSIESASSNNSTRSGVIMPAISPVKSAASGDTTPAHALDVTSPAIQPFAHKLASGFPKRMRVTENVATIAAAADSTVFTAVPTSAAGAAFSHSSDPAIFHASQPTSAIRHPSSTYTTLCPGIAVDNPSCGNFPLRGPAIHTSASAETPPSP